MKNDLFYKGDPRQEVSPDGSNTWWIFRYEALNYAPVVSFLLGQTAHSMCVSQKLCVDTAGIPFSQSSVMVLSQTLHL